jgi:hypothetical protein
MKVGVRECDTNKPPNRLVEHWHGATPTNGMWPIAFSEALDDGTVAWMRQVSEEQYRCGCQGGSLGAARFSSLRFVSLGRFDHATPELALMWEVVGHWIVERVVVLPDNDCIRSPDQAEMEFRPPGVTIQLTEQFVAFRRRKLDNATAINRYVHEQVPLAIPRITGHQWMNDWRSVLHRFRFLFRIPTLGVLCCRHAMVAMQSLDPFLQFIGQCVISCRAAGEQRVDRRQYLRVKRKDAGRQLAERMVHVPEIDLLLLIGSGMDGADFRWVASIHDHVFLHGRAEDPQKIRILIRREVLIAKHKNFAVG